MRALYSLGGFAAVAIAATLISVMTVSLVEGDRRGPGLITL